MSWVNTIYYYLIQLPACVTKDRIRRVTSLDLDHPLNMHCHEMLDKSQFAPSFAGTLTLAPFSIKQGYTLCVCA